MRYHFSPSTGKILPCTAKVCPYGSISEHFNSSQEAMEYADFVNEKKAEFQEERKSKTDAELSLSKNPFSRAYIYTKGYQGDITKENYLTQKELLKNKNLIPKLIDSNDSYIARKALEKYYKNYKDTSLNTRTINNIYKKTEESLSKNPKDEKTRTELAYLNQYKQIIKGNSSLAETGDILKTVNTPDGGATFNPINNSSPVAGFCYSPYPEASRTVKFTDNLADNKKKLMDYMKENKELLSKKNHYIGLWNDPATGIIYMDVSVHSMNAKTAREQCEQKDQIAYFDLQTGESVTVNQNATSGQGDSYTSNMKELENEGVFSESLSNNIKNTKDKDLDKMFEYFKQNPSADDLDIGFSI